MTDDARVLFDRLGGTAAVAKIVQEAYDRIMDDPMLSPFFADTSMERLKHMQYQFLAAAFDGPVAYSGAELTQVHAGRGITARHFARFCEHFADAMQSHDVNQKDLDDALARLAIYKDRVTGDTNVGG
ncbi:group I truncated hemoglobin [Stieleria varia]|uniref:Group 1 truncated hemoglobin n=1 Tax=Stieleria varia TaxID=2528005 RepID=A0A5C6AQ18_9BACT|nr:group 1 truncated hemoglobin [Stieleria varia]TWU02133.1 hypothetical protein Pla52n_31820 [Stieleria varia]